MPVIFTDDFSSGDFSAWDTVTGDSTVIDSLPTPVPTPPLPSGAFFVGYPWRFFVTDLKIVTTTWADYLMRNRKVTRTLGAATPIECDVTPDDFRVNGIWDDGYPRIAQSNRIIYAFRRDGPDDEPWQPRAAGIIMAVEDEGDVDVPLTHLTAYDPRKLLEARPVLKPDGSLPGQQGGYPLFTTADVVVGTVLANTIAYDGGVFIDAGVAYGGTADWAGTIETCGEVNYIAQAGEFVADTWDNLEGGGLCDIILTPIYDPTRTITVDGNVYHFTHDLSIYNLAGRDRYNALFSWDALNKSLAKAARMHDATPGQFFDVVQYFAGQGGFPVPSSPLENAAAIAVFGRYWATQFFPSQTNSDPLSASVFALAQQALVLAKQGKRTFTMDPIPERAPIWHSDYDLGDRVEVHTSNRLRVAADGLQRVQGIPIQINDDGAYESIASLLVTPDYRGPSVQNLTPDTGPALSTFPGVTVVVSGFDGGASLTVTVGGSSATITSGGTTSVNGYSLVTFTVPVLVAGTHAVVVGDGTNSATSNDPWVST